MVGVWIFAGTTDCALNCLLITAKIISFISCRKLLTLLLSLYCCARQCKTALFFRYDPRELDVVLREVVVMNARAEMYLRFIEKRIMVRILRSLQVSLLFIAKMTMCMNFKCQTNYIPKTAAPPRCRSVEMRTQGTILMKNVIM